MKYVIFGNPALCWMIAYQIKYISPNICTFVVYSDQEIDTYFEINKTFIDRLRFFGVSEDDFFLGCRWCENKYKEISNVVSLNDFLEVSDETYVLDTKKTVNYFKQRCEMVYKHWNPNENAESIIDRVYHVNKSLVNVAREKDIIDHLRVKDEIDEILVRGEVFIDMRI